MQQYVKDIEARGVGRLQRRQRPALCFTSTACTPPGLQHTRSQWPQNVITSGRCDRAVLLQPMRRPKPLS